MGKQLMQESGRVRIIMWDTPWPPVYEVWKGDELLYIRKTWQAAVRRYLQTVAMERGA